MRYRDLSLLKQASIKGHLACGYVKTLGFPTLRIGRHDWFKISDMACKIITCRLEERLQHKLQSTEFNRPQIRPLKFPLASNQLIHVPVGTHKFTIEKLSLCTDQPNCKVTREVG